MTLLTPSNDTLITSLLILSNTNHSISSICKWAPFNQGYAKITAKRVFLWDNTSRKNQKEIRCKEAGDGPHWEDFLSRGCNNRRKKVIITEAKWCLYNLNKCFNNYNLTHIQINMQSFFRIREQEKSEKSAIFFKPLGLSKKFMQLQGKTKLDDGASKHPFLKRVPDQIFMYKRKKSSLALKEMRDTMRLLELKQR